MTQALTQAGVQPAMKVKTITSGAPNMAALLRPKSERMAR